MAGLDLPSGDWGTWKVELDQCAGRMLMEGAGYSSGGLKEPDSMLFPQSGHLPSSASE